MTEGLFDTTSDGIDPATITVDPNKNYYEELVGEGKKYKDNLALARARVEADAHIARLEQEARTRNEDLLEVQNELNARTRMEEIRDQILAAKNNQSPSNSSQPNGDTRDTDQSGFTKEDISKLVSETMAEAEARRRKEDNVNLVKSKLVEKFGSRYAEVLKNKSHELGLDPKEADRLAENAPVAFLEMLGVNREPTKRGFTPTSSFSTSSVDSSNDVKKTYSYYDNIRKTDKAKFNSPEIQRERWEMASKLGEAFFDVD